SPKMPGNYEVNFNASNLSSGVYFYKLEAGDFIDTKRMLLVK
ncbi:MAG: T9SS type A sorting domain-containing protein, partial [Ignavibacteriales bacterium]|nr:T9SS type A sorting domain-containing protein [Ignavibacteriales bacterium]